MEIVFKIMMFVLWVMCCGVMVYAIIDMIRIRRESKRIDKEIQEYLKELEEQDLTTTFVNNPPITPIGDGYSSYSERYKNLVEELERHDILVYELDNEKCILMPKERRD